MSKTDLQLKQDQAVELAIKSIEKDYGPGSIQQLKSGAVPGVEFFPSGSFVLDEALGGPGGGYAKGRIVEIFGPASAGKTTLALEAIASAQRVDPLRHVAYIDAEHALDPQYAQKLGVDFDRVLISQPGSAEEALNILDTLVKSGTISIAVVDSVAALTPLKELEGDMGDQHMGLQSRLMSQAMRKIVAPANHSKTTIIFINQIRMKIGLVFGNPETTSGGNALGFYASQRLDIRRKDKLEDKDESVYGCKTHVKVVKNKVFPPFREVDFNIRFNEGIDKFDDLIEAASNRGIIEKSGSWYSFQGERLGQGPANVKEFLQANPAKKEVIFKLLLAPA